jgi:esterase/lipase superfamily enzyme
MFPGLMLLFGALSGCATDMPHMMVTPEAYKDQRLDFYSRIPADLRTTEVPVFFSTRRAPVAPGEPGNYAYKVNKDGLRLGISYVELGEPGWTYDQLIASDLTSTVEKPRPGRVIRIEEIGTVPAGAPPTDVEREFIARINANIAKSPDPEVVLYVHGYRVAFDEVAVLMGSMSTYLGYGTTVAFQWPTNLHWWNYLTDCPNAEQFVPDIERTIEILSRTNAKYINLLGYSCGSPLVAEALTNLRTRYKEEGREALARRFRIGNVVFAASDIDLKTFARDYIPSILDIGKQCVVYVSRNDGALGFSSLVSGASRIGRPDIADLSVDDLERHAADPRLQAIDVSDVRGAHEMGGMRGHGYWYANEWISNDVLLSLRHPIPPEKRCLVPKGNSKNTWFIPDNYPDCVANAILKSFPQLKRAAEQ